MERSKRKSRNNIDSSQAMEWVDADTFRVGDKLYNMAIGVERHCAGCDCLIGSLSGVIKGKIYCLKCFNERVKKEKTRTHQRGSGLTTNF